VTRSNHPEEDHRITFNPRDECGVDDEDEDGGDLHIQPIPTRLYAADGVASGQIACGSQHLVCIDPQGDVYSWGWNWSGMLGHGDLKDRHSPTLVKAFKLVRTMRSTTFKQVAAGSDHTLALTGHGDVYAVGGNPDGQLGLGEKGEVYAFPQLVPDLHRTSIVQVCCGGGHSLALSNTGVVFSWGRGKNGRLGHGNTMNASRPRPIRALLSKSKQMLVKSAASGIALSIGCGWSHSMCITIDGSVYTWGKGGDGILGHGDEEDRLLPTAIELAHFEGHRPRMVTAGYYHSACLCIDGEVFTWGWGHHGQLGHGDTETCLVPRRLEKLSPSRLSSVVIDIDCGGSHTVAALENGHVYTWGLGDSGQLGQSSNHSRATPRPIEPFASIYSDPEKHVSPGTPLKVLASWWHSVVVIAERPLVTESRFVPSSHRIEPKPEPANSSSEDLSQFALSSMRPPRGSSLSSTSSISSSSSSSSQRKRSNSLLEGTRAAVDRVSEWFENTVRDVFQVNNDLVDEVAERQREAVWRSSLADWQAFLGRARSQEEWRKGVPLSLRAQVWRLAVPYDSLRDLSREHYVEMAARVARLRRQPDRNSEESKTFQSTSRLIEVDLPRTFAHTNTFKPGQPLHADLRTVLEVFSVHDPELCYVQGMSYHAAVLLFYLEPYESFRILCALMRRPLFRSLFMMEPKQLIRELGRFDMLFRANMPSLHTHFRRLEISSEQYLLDWLMSVYSRALPLRTCFRVWDCLLLEGDSFLYRVALALLYIKQKELLLSSFEGCVDALRSVKKIEESVLFQAIELITIPDVVADW